MSVPYRWRVIARNGIPEMSEWSNSTEQMPLKKLKQNFPEAKLTLMKMRVPWSRRKEIVWEIKRENDLSWHVWFDTSADGEQEMLQQIQFNNQKSK